MATSFWKTRSIRSQLLFMGLLVIIPAISLVAWFISQDYQSARNSAYSKVGTLAQETANSLGGVISENKSVLERIAGRPLVQAMDRTRCDPILNAYIEVRPEFGTLAIRDANANIICSRISNPPPASAIITRPWFQEISRTRRFTISDVRMRESPPGWVFISAYPILKAQGEMAGIVFFSTNLLKLNHHLFQPGHANTIVEVVDQNGHFVLRSIDPENWIGKSAPSPLKEQFASRPAGSFVYTGDDKIRRIYASAPVPGTGWYALAGLPEDEVLAEPRRHLYQGIATGAIVLLLVIALAITVSINITNPLYKLAGFSDKLAAGDSAARVVNIGGSAEVTHLGQSLNVMAEKLHDRQTALDEAQRLAELGNWQWFFDTHEIKGSAETLRIHGCDETSQPLHLDRLVQHYSPESRDELHRAIEQTGRSGIPYAIDLKTVDDRWITARGEAIRDEHGSIRGIRGTWQDITERKHAMEQINALNADLERRVMQRTSQLEKTNELLNHALESADAANLAKSAFLANMSHEIRTPLNAISGMSHLIKRDGVTPEQSRRIDAINSAGRHLLRIVDDILDISKIEAGKLVLEETEIQIAAIAADAASMVSESAREKNLQLVVDLQPLPRLLLGDPTRIRQALLNYLSNAIKFTASGKVVLRGRCEQETADDAIIRFEVEDTGIGISEETSQRLFARFEQADNSTTRKYGGTGLGLAIVRKLALLMGGDAGFSGALGVGSTFWFTIHLKKASGAVPADTQGATLSAESILNRHWVGRRVLLVEDEPVNREISQILLEDAGLSVDIAEDGLQAVQRAELNDYDIILMDMQMPRMDGLEATSMIRRLPNGGNVPIIAMTANTFVQDKTRCIDAGMNDFVSKPVKPALLYETILKWLQKVQCVTHS